jgi:hypothetical protein
MSGAWSEKSALLTRGAGTGVKRVVDAPTTRSVPTYYELEWILNTLKLAATTDTDRLKLANVILTGFNQPSIVVVKPRGCFNFPSLPGSDRRRLRAAADTAVLKARWVVSTSQYFAVDAYIQMVNGRVAATASMAHSGPRATVRDSLAAIVKEPITNVWA